jgi:thioredoxin-related protein
MNNMITNFLKTALIISAVIATSTSLTAQNSGKVNWYSIEEAEKLAEKSTRPLFIDTYTDWCSWCKKLDSDTFSNPVIAEILNTKFYPVKFNAEGKDAVTFKGNKFINDGKNGRTHQLAIALLQGKMGYPSVVFFNEKIELLTVVPGYKSARDMEPILVFFADKVYETKKYDEFTASFKGSVK